MDGGLADGADCGVASVLAGCWLSGVEVDGVVEAVGGAGVVCGAGVCAGAVVAGGVCVGVVGAGVVDAGAVVWAGVDWAVGFGCAVVVVVCACAAETAKAARAAMASKRMTWGDGE